MAKNDIEIAEKLAEHGWLLLDRNGIRVTIQCIHCGMNKNTTWYVKQDYCHCTDGMNANTYLPIVENVYHCLKCDSTLVLCSGCKTEVKDKPICAICNHKYGHPVFEHEDRHLCLCLLNRVKMCSPTK